MMEDKKTLMVVAAHPTTRNSVRVERLPNTCAKGWRAVYVICTNGDKGTPDPEMTSERLAVIREQEQKDAAKVLGVSEIIFLGHPDGWLVDGPEFRGELVRLIRKYRPELVITHDPTANIWAPRPPHHGTGLQWTRFSLLPRPSFFTRNTKPKD